jgi:hypothetical protein
MRGRSRKLHSERCFPTWAKNKKTGVNAEIAGGKNATETALRAPRASLTAGEIKHFVFIVGKFVGELPVVAGMSMSFEIHINSER